MNVGAVRFFFRVASSVGSGTKRYRGQLCYNVPPAMYRLCLISSNITAADMSSLSSSLSKVEMGKVEMGKVEMQKVEMRKVGNAAGCLRNGSTRVIPSAMVQSQVTGQQVRYRYIGDLDAHTTYLARKTIKESTAKILRRRNLCREHRERRATPHHIAAGGSDMFFLGFFSE